MNEREIPGLPDRDPREVVEVYRPREHREVVEVYTRPLPGGCRPKPPVRPRRRRSRRGLWVFLACFGLTAALALTAVLARFWWWGGPQVEYYPEDGWEESPQGVSIPTYPIGQGVTLTVGNDPGAVLTPQEIYRTVNPAVVTVMAPLSDGSGVSVGTGVVFTPDGYILTNYHVVDGGVSCAVALDTGEQYDARYVAGDAEKDLAVLKVEAEGLPTATFGDSDLLTVGDPVYAIGNPLGVELRGTFTDGIVSAIDRDVLVEDHTMTLIQTNVALNSGNSGGPLINQYGQVVGINVIKMSSRYSNVEGLGFAIPSASMERMVNDLLAFGEVTPEPLLGVSVSIQGTAFSDGSVGVEVVEVTPGSAADLAGIRVGDYILTAGGVEIDSSRTLLRVRRQYHVGEELSMTLLRDGALVEATLLLSQGVE